MGAAHTRTHNRCFLKVMHNRRHNNHRPSLGPQQRHPQISHGPKRPGLLQRAATLVRPQETQDRRMHRLRLRQQRAAMVKRCQSPRC